MIGLLKYRKERPLQVSSPIMKGNNYRNEGMARTSL